MLGLLQGVFSKLPKLESKSLKYGYSNARIRGMKSGLLNASALNELIKAGSVDAMVELLQRTSYKTELSQVSLEFEGSRLIEVAASHNFAKVVARIVKIAPKSDKPIIRALLLKWDLMNLKILMHARELAQEYEDVKLSLFHVGGMDESDFRKILRADDKELIREVKHTSLGSVLFSQSEKKDDVSDIFSDALQSTKSFFKHEEQVDVCTYLLVERYLLAAGGKETERIRDILRREVDARNFLIIQRLKKKGADKKQILGKLVRGGDIYKDQVEKIIDAKDLPAAIAVVRSRFPGLVIKDDLSLTALEIELEKSLATQKDQMFDRAVLSVGVLVGFLLIKEEEISNLRKIAKAKEFGIPENEVRDMLVSV